MSPFISVSRHFGRNKKTIHKLRFITPQKRGVMQPAILPDILRITPTFSVAYYIIILSQHNVAIRKEGSVEHLYPRMNHLRKTRNIHLCAIKNECDKQSILIDNDRAASAKTLPYGNLIFLYKGCIQQFLRFS